MRAMDLFQRVLKNRDVFGQPIQLAYKGKDTYNTSIGGILTLLMQGLTVAYMITAITELVSMDDPILIDYQQEMSEEEKLNQAIDFDEMDYVLAFQMKEMIPAEIGSINAYIVHHSLNTKT